MTVNAVTHKLIGNCGNVEIFVKIHAITLTIMGIETCDGTLEVALEIATPTEEEITYMTAEESGEIGVT